MKNYLRFLFDVTVRKVSLWVITAIYMLILLAFGLIVPLAANIPPLLVFLYESGGVYFVIILLCATVSGVIAGIIFKLQQDDGSELIISAKPIERRKMIFAKFLAYCISMVAISLLTALIFLVLMFVPTNSYAMVGWLFLGTFVGNMVCMLLFGSIAILCSLKLGRVTLIITNVCIVLLMSIYNTVTKVTKQLPTDTLNRQQKYVLHSESYINKNNEPVGSAYFAPISRDIENLETYLKAATIEGQKEIWEDAVKNSNIDKLYIFNWISQLKQEFWSGGLYNAWLECEVSFGHSAGRNYNITNNVNTLAQDFVDKTQEATEIKKLTVNDDNPYWTNVYKKDCPPTWFNLASVSREDTYNLVKLNSTAVSEEEIPDTIYNVMLGMLYLNSRCHVAWLGNDSPGAIEGNNKYFYDVSKTKAVDTWIASKFNDGPNVEEYRKYINWQNININEYEIDLFNWMLYKMLFTKNDYFGDPTGSKILFSDNQLDKQWRINIVREGDNKEYSKVNRIIYEDFFSQKEIKNKLNLNTARDVGWEIMKFKFYSILKLTGQAGIEDYEIKNFNEPGVVHTVPWDAYFKCVYNTQFNSMNIANASEFNENGKWFIGNGIFPINNYAPANSETNYLNSFVADEKYQPGDQVAINRLTPIYNGSLYSVDNKPGSVDKSGQVNSDIFMAYDFTANPEEYETWSSYPTLANKYGYISRLGLSAYSFIEWYCCANNDSSSIYFNNKHYFDYESSIFRKGISNIAFCNMLFNYEQEITIPIWTSAAFFVALSLGFMAIAYTRYLKYDFK